MLTTIFDERFMKHEVPVNHPERPDRVIEALNGVNELSRVIHPTTNVDVVETLSLIHEYHYIERALSLCATGGELDPDTYISKGTCDALSAEVNSIVTAVNLIKSGEEQVYVPLRPPGHHSGFRGRALLAPTQGFCIFNNAALAAALLLKNGASRVAILDVDAHHGNGTQEIFYTTSKVFYISTHQDPRTIYPGTGYVNEVGVGDGEGFNMNFPLPPMTGDDLYSVVLRVIDGAIRSYRPDYIVVSLGFDAHYLDPITNLNLSLNSYVRVFKLIRDLIKGGVSRGSIYVLEGGYVNDVLRLGSRYLAMVANDMDINDIEGETLTDAGVVKYFNKMVEQHRSTFPQYWEGIDPILRR